MLEESRDKDICQRTAFASHVLAVLSRRIRRRKRNRNRRRLLNHKCQFRKHEALKRKHETQDGNGGNEVRNSTAKARCKASTLAQTRHNASHTLQYTLAAYTPCNLRCSRACSRVCSRLAWCRWAAVRRWGGDGGDVRLRRIS